MFSIYGSPAPCPTSTRSSASRHSRSEGSRSEYSADYQEFLRLPTAALKHHVLYLRLAGALSDINQKFGQQAFQIGGIPIGIQRRLSGIPPPADRCAEASCSLSTARRRPVRHQPEVRPAGIPDRRDPDRNTAPTIRNSSACRPLR